MALVAVKWEIQRGFRGNRADLNDGEMLAKEDGPREQSDHQIGGGLPLRAASA